MAVRSEIVKDLRKAFDDPRKGLMTRKELAVYMGYKDPKSVSPILEGLPHIGGTKKYSVIDIAERLASMEVYR